MSRDVDLVVVGGGAMGSAAAWAAVRRGMSVALLERFESGHIRGSSHAKARLFRTFYGDPTYTAMTARAIPEWRQLEADTGTELLTQTGIIDRGTTGELEPLAAACASADLSVETLDPDVATARFPGIRFGELGALFQPDGGRVEAAATVAAAQQFVIDNGGSVSHDTRVIGIDLGTESVVVRTEIGEPFTATRVIVTTNAWTEGLLRGVVDHRPVIPTKEQVAYFRPATDSAWPGFVHREAGTVIYGFDNGDGLVKVGGMSEGPIVDPDQRDFDPDTALLERLVGHVRDWLPGLDPTPVRTDTCLYASTPTQDFILDRQGPLVVGAGFSGHGFKFTPLIGTMLCDLAQQPLSADPADVRPAQMALAPTDTESSIRHRQTGS